MFDNLRQWLRKYISPVFVAMLVASFVLWYIAKLNYTYTTDKTVQVNVDGEEFEVVCVIEGLGTNLFSRMVYMRNSLRIPLSELDYAPFARRGGVHRHRPAVVAKCHFGALQRREGRRRAQYSAH